MKFVNRKKELEILKTFFDKKHFQFLPIYGRRRVGKTRLVQEFIKDKSAIYFLADSVAESEQLKKLGQEVGHFFQDTFLFETGFQNWYQFFEYLLKNTKKRTVFIIDKFPYLVNANKAISSIFQKGIDQYLVKADIFLILMGSSIGMMEKEVLYYKAPLYGRRSGSLEVTEMSFSSLNEFFPKMDMAQLLSIYSVTGTIPAYIEKINPKANIFSNIENQVLTKGTFLYNEVEYLLREELREPRNYFVILRSIAQGKRKLSEIINDTGFEKSMISRYLDILRNLRLVQKEVPITEKYPDKSKLGLYRIHDKFLEFWFKYVFPNRNRLELEKTKEVLQIIKKTFNQHMSLSFEEVCRKHCLSLMQNDKLMFSLIGKWWHKNEEIDIVALDEEAKVIYCCEVKWSKKKVGTDILKNLERKAALIDWGKNKRTVKYILFSRSGYTDALVKKSIKDNILLITVKYNRFELL